MCPNVTAHRLLSTSATSLRGTHWFPSVQLPIQARLKSAAAASSFLNFRNLRSVNIPSPRPGAFSSFSTIPQSNQRITIFSPPCLSIRRRYICAFPCV